MLPAVRLNRPSSDLLFSLQETLPHTELSFTGKTANCGMADEGERERESERVGNDVAE